MAYYPLDLRHYINERTVPEASAKVISRNLLSALVFLQNEHILHRDIKPSNILINREPLAAVLADFGAARYVWPHASSSQEGLSADVCTLWYASPEMLIKANEYSFPSDTWSVGVTTAEMAKGKALFEKHTQKLVWSSTYFVSWARPRLPSGTHSDFRTWD